MSDSTHATDELREANARFRAMMEQAPFSVQVFAPDGRTLRVNRAWEQLWRFPFEQLQAIDYNVLEDPQLEAKGVLPYLRRAFAGEPVEIPDIRYDLAETVPDQPRDEASMRWVAAVAYPLKDDKGMVREVVLIHEDISKRKQIETALQQSEERLRLALDAGHMGVWDWNLHTGEVNWSDNLEPLHGFERGAFGGTFEDFRRLIHPEDREMVDCAIRRAVETGSGYDVEFRTTRSGSVQWIAGKGKVFLGDDGQPARMIGVGLDITQRKRSEQTARFLADASATLAVLVDFDSTLQKLASLAVPHFADWAAVDVINGEGNWDRVAVAHIDPDKVALAHELHRRLPPRQDATTGAWQILRTGQAQLVREISDELLSGISDEPDLLAILRKLGLRSYIGVPLKARGKILGVITFIAAESGHLYEHSDLLVAQDLADRASIAIENSQLYRELRETDRQKDEFLATLAHELRNPLAPIRTGLEVLKLVKNDAAIAEEIRETMERQTQQLITLVDDLLDVSRITRGKLQLRKCRVSLTDVVQSAVETSRPLIDELRHELFITLPDGRITLEADPHRFAQIISNLLNNAAKYTPEGGRIELTAEQHGSDLLLTVRDSGIGIPEDMLDRIFEMFAQIERRIEKGYTGLGIGLTLVKTLVEMHGGTIDVDSVGPNRGSEFRVRLPLLPEPPAVKHVGIPTGGRHAGGARRRVLVVDDNQAAANMLSMAVKILGNDVRSANDGEEAVDVAAKFRPEVVLMDLGMPRMNGFEAARRIRKQPWGEKIMLIALTGWGQDEDKQRSKAAGFDHHLVKPAEPAELQRLIATLDDPPHATGF